MSDVELRVQGIVLVGDRILLARHARRDTRYWVLPGGHREVGETLEQALARELEEEAAIRPRRVSLFSVSEMLLDSREVVDIVFRVAEFEGRPRLGRVPAASADRRLESLALHRHEDLPTLAFRPAPLGEEIGSAWARNDWGRARYLGNLAGPRPPRR